MNDFRRLGDYRNFIGSYRYQHRQYSDHAKEPPPMSDSNDLRARIANVLHRELSPPCCDECHDWGPEPWEIELADALIRELELQPETRIGRRRYIRYVTGWRVDD